MSRLWSGHGDPDPIVVQIGAVLLDLDDHASIVDQTKIYIKPTDRDGLPCQLDPYFVQLTGITSDVLASDAVDLGNALKQFSTFSRGTDLWSWGKDELFTLAVSCFVRGIAPPIGATRFGNLKNILSKAGMIEKDIKSTNSGELADYYGVGCESLAEHDALDDSLSLARTLRHLMLEGLLIPNNFATVQCRADP